MALHPVGHQIGHGVPKHHRFCLVQAQPSAGLVGEDGVRFAVVRIQKPDLMGLSLGNQFQGAVHRLLAGPDHLPAQAGFFQLEQPLDRRHRQRRRQPLPVPLCDKAPLLQVQLADVAGESERLPEPRPFHGQMSFHRVIEKVDVHNGRDFTGLCRRDAM